VGKSFDGRRDARPTIKPPKVAFPRDIGINSLGKGMRLQPDSEGDRPRRLPHGRDRVGSPSGGCAGLEKFPPARLGSAFQDPFEFLRWRLKMRRISSMPCRSSLAPCPDGTVF